ncbi:hypothetical protein PJN19_05100, partial [Mycobacterium kansasii]
RQVGHGLVAHLGPVAEGAAQQHRLIDALFALLIHMRLFNSDYVSFALVTRHTKHHSLITPIRYE